MPSNGAVDEEALMREALAEAAAATSDGCMPFGAILADEHGKILCRAHNQCRAGNRRGGASSAVDVTRHAEMELVRKFTADPDLPSDARSSWTLYTSTEPCVMCAGAIYWSGVGRVVYGCSAAQLETLSGPGGFDIDNRVLYSMASRGARKIQVEGPFLSDESLYVHALAGIWKNSEEFLASYQEKTKAADSAPPPTQAQLDIAVEASLKTTGLGSAAVRDDGVVPTIDLTAPDAADQLWKAATEVGFFSLINHGIDAAVIDAAFAVSEDFFTQPLEAKKEQSPLDMSINCGFEYFAQVRPSTGVADQKESLQVTARAGGMEGRWPNPTFRSAAEELLQQAHALANRVLDLLEPRATPHLPPGTLAKSHTLWQEDGQCTLRFLHYPPLPAEATEKLLKDGYWRAGPHTDWDNVTLLFQRPGQGGLECCANPRTGDPKDMYWTAIHPVPGAVAVNIGDMLARWSDGRLYSNLHRVRLPQDASRSRYSIAYFAQADKKTLIESQDSAPITAGDYILSRIQSNFAK